MIIFIFDIYLKICYNYIEVVREEFYMKLFFYGVLHTLISLTCILFVAGSTGLNVSLAFLTVGLGTLVFHLLTKNKFAAIMGLSGSYIGGLVLVGSQYGVEYAAGGSVLAGIIYVLVGLLAKKYPKIIGSFPKYVLNTAVLLIALNLLPVGVNLIAGHEIAAIIIIAVALVSYVNKKLNAYTLPIALIFGVLLATVTGNLGTFTDFGTVSLVFPKFNFEAFALIGVVAIAVAFETMGDITNCSMAQGIETDEHDLADALVANGAASVVSGAIGGVPLTSYSENVGLIYATKYTNPWAQVVTALIYIVLAFVPAVSGVVGMIPSYVFGAVLIFLFGMIGISSVCKIGESNDKNPNTMIAMLVTFYATPSTLFSPIAAAIIVGMIFHYITRER